MRSVKKKDEINRKEKEGLLRGGVKGLYIFRDFH
jgi:hypothetical protein